jgi:transposase
MKDVPLSHLKFIDESACHLSLTRSYGWAGRGAPCVGQVPGNSGSRRSMVALFSCLGIQTHRVQSGSLKQIDFESFIKEQVVPHLSRGDVVVVDNARCHQGKKAREAIEAAGARLVFLPAYSPDFAPIELAWRQVKAFLRQTGARTAESLLSAITQAMTRVTAEQAVEYFAHCGYRTLQHQ